MPSSASSTTTTFCLATSKGLVRRRSLPLLGLLGSSLGRGGAGTVPLLLRGGRSLPSLPRGRGRARRTGRGGRLLACGLLCRVCQTRDIAKQSRLLPRVSLLLQTLHQRIRKEGRGRLQHRRRTKGLSLLLGQNPIPRQDRVSPQEDRRSPKGGSLGGNKAYCLSTRTKHILYFRWDPLTP